MSLRYALLALLTAQPLTGYDAAKHFRSTVGHIWHAPDSQIYPELRRMADEGLVKTQEVPWGPNSTKTQYAVTKKGTTAFRAWMNTPLEYGPVRDQAYMQAGYFEWADEEQVRVQLRNHIAYYEEQVQLWTAVRATIVDGSAPLIAARLEAAPPDEHERIIAFKAFAYDGLIRRGKGEIAWARSGLKLLERLR